MPGRLEAAERLGARADLPAHMDLTNREYLAACGKAEAAAKGRRRFAQALIYLLLMGIIAERCSSVVAFNEMASFTSVSFPSRSMSGTKPTVRATVGMSA